jgi:hypothetical protein
MHRHFLTKSEKKIANSDTQIEGSTKPEHSNMIFNPEISKLMWVKHGKTIINQSPNHHN